MFDSLLLLLLLLSGSGGIYIVLRALGCRIDFRALVLAGQFGLHVLCAARIRS